MVAERRDERGVALAERVDRDRAGALWELGVEGGVRGGGIQHTNSSLLSPPAAITPPPWSICPLYYHLSSWTTPHAPATITPLVHLPAGDGGPP